MAKFGNYTPSEDTKTTPNIKRIGCTKVEKLYINESALLEFEVEGESSRDFGGGYKVVLKPSDSNIKLFDRNKQIKTDFEVEKGWKFSVYVGGSKIVSNAKIDVFVDGIKKLSFPISIHEDKDVFSKEEVKRLIDEFLLIEPKADAGSSSDPSVKNSVALEYRQNYCVYATSRAFGKLLNDTKNFWVYNDSTNKVINRVLLTSGTYIGNQLLKNNYASAFYQFDEYLKDVNHMKEYIIDRSFDGHAYNVIKLKSGKSLFKEYFLPQMNNNIGFHIFLLTVSDDFHVLAIVINNQNPCKTTYEIYDQHGLSTSKGDINNIDEGIRRQTSWTFLNDFANRGYNISSYGKTINRLWKIQRK